MMSRHGIRNTRNEKEGEIGSVNDSRFTIVVFGWFSAASTQLQGVSPPTLPTLGKSGIIPSRNDFCRYRKRKADLERYHQPPIDTL